MVLSDMALDALRAWIAAYVSLSRREATFSLAPALTLAAPDGTLLFCPPSVARRSLEAGSAGIHPDLRGEEAIVFTAATLLRVRHRTALVWL
jgi:hypothetical protein